MMSQLGFFGRKRSTQRGHRPNRTLPTLQPLEDRYLLSCPATISGSQLRVNCDAQRNVVTVDHAGSATIINGQSFDDSSFSTILITGGTGGTTETIRATARPLTVMNGGFNDPVIVGDPVNGVAGIQGTLDLECPPDVNFVTVNDSADTSPRTATLDYTGSGADGFGRITGLAPAAITYKLSDTDRITVRTGSGGVTVNASNIPVTLLSVVFTTLVGNEAGVNTLVGNNPSNTFAIVGTDGGTLADPANTNGPIYFSGFQNLQGGAGDSLFAFDDGAAVNGTITGGAGANTLDYSSYRSSVVVNLQTGVATGVGGGVAGIQTVLGGTGGGAAGAYNILVGAGGNTLIGGNGRRNLLIAGPSASVLIGGGDDDILIGGTTAYDTEADNADLIAIMNEWARTDEDYATRVNNLTTGNGVPLLDATTVTGSGGGNTLQGGPGLNLYYGDPFNDVNDWDPNSETFVTV